MSNNNSNKICTKNPKNKRECKVEQRANGKTFAQLIKYLFKQTTPYTYCFWQEHCFFCFTVLELQFTFDVHENIKAFNNVE